MTLLNDSERQDFAAVVLQFGYSLSDFELTECEDKPLTYPLYVITGTVTVRRRSTGVARTYRAGNATAWLADFEADLRGRIFCVA